MSSQTEGLILVIPWLSRLKGSAFRHRWRILEPRLRCFLVPDQRIHLIATFCPACGNPVTVFTQTGQVMAEPQAWTCPYEPCKARHSTSFGSLIFEVLKRFEMPTETT